jgi:hypothetical protein
MEFLLSLVYLDANYRLCQYQYIISTLPSASKESLLEPKNSELMDFDMMDGCTKDHWSLQRSLDVLMNDLCI